MSKLYQGWLYTEKFERDYRNGEIIPNGELEMTPLGHLVVGATVVLSVALYLTGVVIAVKMYGPVSLLWVAVGMIAMGNSALWVSWKRARRATTLNKVKSEINKAADL